MQRKIALSVLYSFGIFDPIMIKPIPIQQPTIAPTDDNKESVKGLFLNKPKIILTIGVIIDMITPIFNIRFWSGLINYNPIKYRHTPLT